MRVLLACHAVPGHLNPNMALARNLVERGHETAIYTGSLGRGVVESQGYRYFPFNPGFDQRIEPIMLPSGGVSNMATVATRRAWAFRLTELNQTLSDWLINSIPDQVEDLIEIARQYRPDVLVTDSTLLGPILVLRETWNVPVAVFSVLAGCTIPGPQAPPWGRGLPPPRTFRTRLLCSVSDFLVSRLTQGFRARANEIRKQYGLPALEGRVAEQYARVPLFMVASTPSFDYDRTDLPSCVKYVGACSWDSGKQEKSPNWMKQLNGSRKVVHVTEGTLHTARPLVLRAAAQGLGDLPVDVVMTSGAHRKPEQLDLGPIAPNIRIEQFVPHSLLLPRTHVVITTGGAGTVTKALLAGVPLIVVPTAWELPENAQRVVESGAGIRINPRRCTPARIRGAVERILGDPSYARNARRVGQDLRQQGGPARAVDLLEELLTAEPGAISQKVGLKNQSKNMEDIR